MPKPARLFAEMFGSQPRSTIIRTFDITEMAPVVMRLAETDDSACFDPPWLPPQPIGPVTRTVCGGLLSPFARPDAISGGPNDQGELG